jgi:hypothetical protein
LDLRERKSPEDDEIFILSSYVTFTLHESSKEDEIGGICGTRKGMRNAYVTLVENYMEEST